MEYSENYNFNLPTDEDDTLADIGLISENFETVDRVMKQKSDATNLVNGSAEGSLRSISAKAEDSDYTMGAYAVSEGYQTTASGNNSHSEGRETTASGSNSHAEGNNNTASGAGSHAEGGANNTASNKGSHAEGSGNCVASGVGSHAEGSWATASGSYSHAEGSGTKAYGEANHAEGISTTAYSEASHAEGHSTTASNSCSHAEGYLTKASGKNSHAEGDRAESSGECSHSEGYETTASGGYSHAEGRKACAEGYYSHAEGVGTIANGDSQHTQGRYNIEDTENKYAHIVGNGSSDKNRSNAHTLDWDGNAWFAGDVYVGGTSQDDENAINLVNISTENKTDIESLKAKDTDLQSQINAKATREVAIVGSDDENSAGWYKVADGTMPNLNDVSMLFAVHSTVTNKQYAGILQLNLRSDASGNITCPQFGWLLRNGFEDGQVIVTTNGLNWAMYFKVTSPRYYRTFFEVLQKSDRINSALKNYNLYTNSTVETTAPTATFASTDLGNVHQAIADLTARIEALENSVS